jgi:hypothetical protein
VIPANTASLSRFAGRIIDYYSHSRENADAEKVARYE